MHWPCQAIAKHAFCERLERAVGVLLKESGSRGRIALFWVDLGVDRCPELEALVLSCCAARLAECMTSKSGHLVHNDICRASRSLTSSHCPQTLLFQLLNSSLEQTPRTRTDRTSMVRVEEADKEEGHIILPRYAPEAAQVRHSNYIMVSVLRIADIQFPEVCLIVHIPAEDDRTKAESIFCDSYKLLFGHELAAQDAIDVDAGDFDFGVVP